MNRILLLEDDPTLNELMSDFLSSQNYEVTSCSSYDEAINLAGENFDLFVFDVKIIGGNGFELLKELRESGIKTPCIFTTSLNGINDIREGFLSGCDDYIKKPFELAELALRIKNILKREFGGNFVKLNNELNFDVLQKCIIKGDLIINISKKECDLLSFFIANQDKVLSRDEIYSHLWGFEEPSEISLRVYIGKLRKLLGKERIASHSKLGYKFISFKE